LAIYHILIRNIRNPVEYAQIEDSYSPIVHRVNQAIRFRAAHPDLPFEGHISAALTRFSHPPEKLVDDASNEIGALIGAAGVKKGT
jgi:ATP-dependent DNA helicase 2 subunit 2